MAVLCTKCGRQYDVTLFQFGRTIHCACGTRVGFEHRLNLPKSAELKFFADVNVARLVRWLRAAGFDTLWKDAIADGELVRRAIDEKRIVLTLDKKLPKEWSADNVLLLKNEDPLDQFREIARRFRIEKPPGMFTRCLVCNRRLRDASVEEIARNAPQCFSKDNERIRFCRSCGKLYWEGSHTGRMRKTIADLFRLERLYF